jgi:DNA-binding transcriptional ArsR family regulator
MFQEAKRALRAGTYTGRDDFALVRFPLALDERGWVEAAAIHARLIEEIQAIAESTHDNEGSIRASATVLFFESSIASWRAPTGRLPRAPSSAGRASDRNPLDRSEGLLRDQLRLAIVSALAVRPSSATQLARELDAPVERIRYHIRRLRRSGLVRLHSQRVQRGLTEGVFVSEPRQQVFYPYDVPSGRRLESFAARGITSVFREALTATREGAFHDRDDFCVMRIPLLLEGQKEFHQVHQRIHEAVERLIALREESLERLEEYGATSRVAISDVLFFELPPE